MVGRAAREWDAAMAAYASSCGEPVAEKTQRRARVGRGWEWPVAVRRDSEGVEHPGVLVGDLIPGHGGAVVCHETRVGVHSGVHV